MLRTSLLVAAFLLSGCSTLFGGGEKEPVVVVREVTKLVPVPDELINCPDPIVLTAEQILEISQASRDPSEFEEGEEDVDSEDLYNKYFVAPLYERHETCWKSSKAIERWNEKVEQPTDEGANEDP